MPMTWCLLLLLPSCLLCGQVVPSYYPQLKLVPQQPYQWPYQPYQPQYQQRFFSIKPQQSFSTLPRPFQPTSLVDPTNTGELRSTFRSLCSNCSCEEDISCLYHCQKCPARCLTCSCNSTGCRYNCDRCNQPPSKPTSETEVGSSGGSQPTNGDSENGDESSPSSGGNTNGDGGSGTANGDGSSGTTNGEGSSGTTNGDGGSGTTNGDGGSGTTNGDGGSGTTNGDGGSGTTNGDGGSGTTNGDGGSGTANGDSGNNISGVKGVPNSACRELVTSRVELCTWGYPICRFLKFTQFPRCNYDCNTCSYTLPASECTATNGKTCIFPFIYQGVTYSACAPPLGELTENQYWCSTRTDGNWFHIGDPRYPQTKSNIGYCGDSCPKTTFFRLG